MKNALWAHQWAGLSPLVDGLTSRLWKVLVTMKIGQGKPHKVKYKEREEKKAEKYRTEFLKVFGQFQKV